MKNKVNKIMKFEKEILEVLEVTFPMNGVEWEKCEKIEFLITELLEKQHEATKKACVKKAKIIQITNEQDLLNGYYNSINRNEILSIPMPDLD